MAKSHPVLEEPTNAEDRPAVAPKELRTVEEWRDILAPADVPENRHARRNFLAAYAAAAVMHGWNDEVRHYAQSVVVTSEDFSNAIKAIGESDERGEPKTHAPAVGRYARERRAK